MIKPIPTLTSEIRERLWSYVAIDENHCWIWQRAQNGVGYGVFSIDKNIYLAHRVAYTAAKGPIPDGLFLDHLCRVPSCINPDHLEPVTAAENLARGNLGKRMTHCKFGHELSGSNLSPSHMSRGNRRCLECDKRRAKAYRESLKPEGWVAKKKDMTAAIAASSKKKAERTHCKYGHELIGDNVTYRQGYRFCLECGRRRGRDAYDKMKGAGDRKQEKE